MLCYPDCWVRQGPWPLALLSQLPVAISLQLAPAAQPAYPGVYWGLPDDLYAQAWGWFATALYADTLTDLWRRR